MWHRTWSPFKVFFDVIVASQLGIKANPKVVLKSEIARFCASL